MSDEARVRIIRTFIGDDDQLCVKIVSQDGKQNEYIPYITYHTIFYTITEHQHYWRCNDTWYPKVHDGVERMLDDIQRDFRLSAAQVGLSASQMKTLDQAIADLMIAGG